MSSLVPLPSASAKETWMPAEPCSVLTPPVTPREELDAESPDSLDSQTSTTLYSLCPRPPFTYNEAALSQLQGRQQVINANNLFIPFPSDSECSTNTNSNYSMDEEDSDDTNGSPAEVMADSSTPQIESPTAQPGMDMPTQEVQLTTSQVTTVPDPVRKIPSQRHSKIPIGIRSLQDHSVVISGPSSPASRTIWSNSRVVHIPGPSSSTSKVDTSTDRTTCQ